MRDIHLLLHVVQIIIALKLHPNPRLHLNNKSERGSFYNSSDNTSIAAPHYREITLEIQLDSVFLVHYADVYLEFYSNTSIATYFQIEAFSSSTGFNSTQATRVCKTMSHKFHSFPNMTTPQPNTVECAVFTRRLERAADRLIVTVSNAWLSLMFVRIELDVDPIDYRTLPAPRNLVSSVETRLLSDAARKAIRWHHCEHTLFDLLMSTDPLIVFVIKDSKFEVVLTRGASVEGASLFIGLSSDSNPTVEVFLVHSGSDVHCLRTSTMIVDYYENMTYSCLSNQYYKRISIKVPDYNFIFYEIMIMGTFIETRNNETDNLKIIINDDNSFELKFNIIYYLLLILLLGFISNCFIKIFLKKNNNRSNVNELPGIIHQEVNELVLSADLNEDILHHSLSNTKLEFVRKQATNKSEVINITNKDTKYEKITKTWINNMKDMLDSSITAPAPPVTRIIY